MPNEPGRRTFTDEGVPIVRRPQSIAPWSVTPENPKYGSVWVNMKASKIVDQFTKASDGLTKVSTPEVQYSFLAPTMISENIVHHWGQYESIASRLAQKVRSAAKISAELRGLASIFGSNADLGDRTRNLLDQATASPAQAIESFAKQAYQSTPGSTIPKIKIDTPSYYENSDRRRLVLDFKLIVERDPLNDIVEPIKNLMRKSTPDLVGDLTIEFPYIWEVYTYPEKFINYTTCALVAVIPSWNSPYVDGYPMSCDLQLTFEDIAPLYRESYEKGTSIRVINSDTAKSRADKGTVPSLGTFSVTPGTPNRLN